MLATVVRKRIGKLAQYTRSLTSAKKVLIIPGSLQTDVQAAIVNSDLLHTLIKGPSVVDKF